MGTGGTLLSDMQNVVIMPVVALNMMVLLFLIDHASESYLNSMRQKAEKDRGKTSTNHEVVMEFEHARLRLEIFWTFVLIAATATALKIILPVALADNIIAAWFVGQGFALQPYVQSFISGIAVRNNTDVWKAIMNKATLQIEGNFYTRHSHNVFNLTVISSTSTDRVSPETKYRLLQWQNIAQYTIVSRVNTRNTDKDKTIGGTYAKVETTTPRTSVEPELYPYIRSRRHVH